MMIPLELNLKPEVIILPGIIFRRSEAQVDGAFDFRNSWNSPSLTGECSNHDPLSVHGRGYQ
jgi:hypothetical protein